MNIKKIIAGGIIVAALTGTLYLFRHQIKDFWEFNFVADELVNKALAEPKGKIVTPATTAEMAALFQGVMPDAVPRIYVDALPTDFVPETQEDKILFAQVITALALRSNEKIQAERHALQLLEEKRKAGRKWTRKEMRFFEKMADKYDTYIYRSLDSKMAALQQRVDQIPVSLVVAQAVYFSDWGRIHKKSPFGQYYWANTVDYVLQPYMSLVNATDSYMLELNSLSSLIAFHNARETIAPITRHPVGPQLAFYTDYYMPDDPDYRAKLLNVYDVVDLTPLDKAQLIPWKENK